MRSFIICLAIYHEGDHIKENMVGKHVESAREIKMNTKYIVELCEGKNLIEDLGLYGKIILKYVVRK
jgi:hypothetical protein